MSLYRYVLLGSFLSSWRRGVGSGEGFGEVGNSRFLDLLKVS